MSRIGRRQFLAAAGLCWPERGREGGCKLLGRSAPECLPIYRLESRVAERALAATFRLTHMGREASSLADTKPFVRSQHIHWLRHADGSTKVSVPMEVFADLFTVTLHYRSDLRKRELTGFVEFGGLLGPLAALVGEDRVGVPPSEPGTPDVARLSPGLREDGSLSTADTPLPVGGVGLWRYGDLAVEEEAEDSVLIDGRAWPVRRIEMRTGVHPLVPMRASLTVWVSDELSLVLREEARLEGELSRTWETVTLELGASGP